MSQLHGVILSIKNPEPIEVEYDFEKGLWVRTDEDLRVGVDTLTHYIFPNIESVHFGSSCFSLKEWRAAGSPIVLTDNEVATLQTVIHHAHLIDGRI